MLQNISYIFLFGLLIPLVAPRHVQFYRHDYKYIEKFNAFYKFHWDLGGITWNTAFQNCRKEGAKLFYPKVKEEWTIVKNLTKPVGIETNVSEIFVGIHDEYRMESFITIDGHSTPYPLFNDENQLRISSETKRCIMMDMETGRFRIDLCFRPFDEPAPYICKKIDDESCPTIDRGYKFMEETKKCYKVNEQKRTWQEAMETCFMEGGILTVIDNNEAEATFMKSLLKPNIKYFVGLKKMEPFPNDYYLVTGEDIMAHSYGSHIKWYSLYDPQKPCGAFLFSELHLYTATEDCNVQMPFICEMEINH